MMRAHPPTHAVCVHPVCMKVIGLSLVVIWHMSSILYVYFIYTLYKCIFYSYINALHTSYALYIKSFIIYYI